MNQRLKIVISLAAGCAMMLSCVCAGAESGANQEQNREAGSVNVFKTIDQHNPVMVQRFGADPWAMVYNSRVYLYTISAFRKRGQRSSNGSSKKSKNTEQ